MPPSLEAEPVRPRRSLPIPPGPFQYEPHFGLHEPACFGHALLAHIGLSPSCLFRSGPLRNSNLRLRPDMREDEVDRVEKELANPKSMVVITAVMILLPTCAWLKYVHPVVGAHGSWLSLVITLSLASLCLGFLVTAWLVEPGIMHVVSHVDQGSIDPLTKRPKETWYIKDRVTDQEHSLIEFRAKFCRETGNCIENYDHFCPWVGNAVGVRNYRDFVGFVFSTTLLAAFVGSSCVRGLVDHALLSREGPSVVLEAGGAPILGPAVSVILLLYCAVVFFTTFGLLGYHLCLIAKNQTTNEDLKKVYQNVPNLHDQGCLRNFRSKLCTKRRRSVVTTPRSDEDLEQMALVPCLPGTVDRNSIL